MPDDQALFAKLEQEGIEAVRLKRARGAYNPRKAALVDHWLSMKADAAKPPPPTRMQRLLDQVTPRVIGAVVSSAIIGVGLLLLRLCGPSDSPSHNQSKPPATATENPQKAEQTSLPPNKPGLIAK